MLLLPFKKEKIKNFKKKREKREERRERVCGLKSKFVSLKKKGRRSVYGPKPRSINNKRNEIVNEPNFTF